MNNAAQKNGETFECQGVTYRTDIHCGPFVSLAWSYSNNGEGYVCKVTHERVESVRITPTQKISINLTMIAA